ncbi:unnamed protein product [Gongylonema pulchrum]|uniref:Uncharacterized protein n=1 Tax=Gongylonema pulchrum TaxID=637853 RepID=A0A3P6SY79_9BILA|nr:unnamed protein product [Gongylonema pulchrum]
MKTIHCPAHILLRRTPRQFYAINTYLMTVNRHTTPRYKWLVKKMKEAIKEIEEELEKDEIGPRDKSSKSTKRAKAKQTEL